MQNNEHDDSNQPVTTLTPQPKWIANLLQKIEQEHVGLSEYCPTTRPKYCNHFKLI